MAKTPGENRLTSRVDAVRAGLIELPPEEVAATPATQRAKSNPYFLAIQVLTLVGVIVALAAWIIGAGFAGSGDNLIAAAVWLAIGNFAFAVAFVMFVAMLVTGAINWHQTNLKG